MYHLKRMIDEKIDFNFKIIQDDRVELEKDYLQEELHSLDLKENRIKSAYLDGIDTIDEYKANKAMLQTAREKVLLKIENTKPKIEPIDKRKQLLLNMMNVWNVLINEEDYVKKGNALRDICEKIVYDKRADLLAFHFVLKV
jgi:site-specific DNA recombinase